MTAPHLPPPRRPGDPYRIALVCLGNICRSPMAQVVLDDMLARTGLDGQVETRSAGTGDWHVGRPMDRRAAALLTTHGYDASEHLAQQFTPSWFGECDLVLAMDRANHRDLTGLLAAAPSAASDRLRMFRDFDPGAGAGDRDVPDPYYGGDDGFEEVLAMVRPTAESLASALSRERAG